MYLNLAALRFCTESEGPGKRFAIWVQGCKRRCPGCCNPEMQEIKRNKVVAVDDIISLIKKSVEEHQIEGVSFIGGEPVLQAQGLAEVAEWCQRQNLSVLMFTGYMYEDLMNMENEYVQKLLENIDLLVDGPFLQEQYDEEREWIGSRNQKLHFLSERYPKTIEYGDGVRSVELLISEERILINGWPFFEGE